MGAQRSFQGVAVAVLPLLGLLAAIHGEGWFGFSLLPKGGELPVLGVPEGVEISLFADGVDGARHMVFDDRGVLFLTQMKKGKVVALPDGDGDGRADKAVPVLEGRRNPHGLDFAAQGSGYYLYVAEERQVIRMRRTSLPYGYGPPETIIADIPAGGHVSRTLRIRDGALYLSVGSSCNVCLEKSEMRAAVTKVNLLGGEAEVFARGLRNTVGLEFSPWDGELWGVDNGRDWLGDDRPREELNVIRRGRHYGWPFCHEERVPDPEYGGLMECSETEPPAYTFTAHMAPLGMAFYEKGRLPEAYERSLFIAFHGSWNRSVPAGYKVVRVLLDGEGRPQGHEDFVTGWMREDGKVVGRPVDLEMSPEGDLFLSDDRRGTVYRITGGS
jgi:glucose/arabinose dehydrogenase